MSSLINSVSLRKAEERKKFADLAKEAGMIRDLREAKLATQQHYARLQEINELVLEKVDNYIYSFIKTTYPTFINNAEILKDLHAECVLQVLENFPLYNGTNELITFFRNYFYGACNEFIGNSKGLSRYYNEKTIVIMRAKEEIMKHDNVNFEDISISDIKKQLDLQGKHKISQKTIKNVLDISKYRLEEFNPEILDNSDKTFKSPEEILLEKEKMEMLEGILGCLLPYERIALCLRCGYYTEETGFYIENKRLTNAQIGRAKKFIESLKKMNFYDCIELTETGNEYVPQEKVTVIINSARKKLSNNPVVMERSERNREVYGATIPSNVMEDINKTIDFLSFDE